MRVVLIFLMLATAITPMGAQETPVSTRDIQRELLQVPTRKGVIQPCLLMTESPSPKAVAILFPGGNGAVGLGHKPMEAVLGPRGNFLLRSADRLLSPDLALVILDCPSDWSMGMEDAFRASEAHAADVKAVVVLLRIRFKGVKVYLVGTSRGTVSAAYASEALGTEIDGLVLTSSVFNATKKNAGLSSFHFERLKVPLLFVHHAEDGCPACPYSQALRRAERANLITVRGGIEPESGPCDPLSNHGYLGREAPVMKAIRGWILGQPFDRDIP